MFINFEFVKVCIEDDVAVQLSDVIIINVNVNI